MAHGRIGLGRLASSNGLDLRLKIGDLLVDGSPLTTDLFLVGHGSSGEAGAEIEPGEVRSV